MEVEVILYVADQSKSKLFYSQLLGLSPLIDEPGMTAFKLEGLILGLMPNDGIAKIISPVMPHPKLGTGIPRCELYCRVASPETYLRRGKLIGGREVSPLVNRDWGDQAGYLADLDGHIIAFATKITT